MGEVVSGDLLQAAVALREDARIPPTGDQTPDAGVRQPETDGSLSGHDRRLLADPVAGAYPQKNANGHDRKRRRQTFDGASGVPRLPSSAERRRAKETPAIEPVLGRRVPGGGPRVVPAALRVMVGAAGDRSGSAGVPEERDSDYHGDGPSGVPR